jgi:LysR family transcriptional regulator (chromosome initiation inhibitor)
MKFDYALLDALAAVVREGSFERAARALSVTPSAVSQRMKLLEERVGKPLVLRGQPCAATPAGAALCRHVEQVALLEHELGERLPELTRLLGPAISPTLRIAVNADSVATWFVRALSRFSSERRVLFDVVIDDQDYTAKLLRGGEVQGAVTTVAEPAPGCRSVPLGSLRYVGTCSPDFRRRWFAAGVSRDTLRAAPCLVFNPKDRLQHVFARKIARADVEMPTHWLPSSHAFVEGCLHGLGWGLNPKPLVIDALARGDLVDMIPGRHIDVALFWQSWRLSSATFDRLVEIIVEEARRALRRASA